MFPDWLGNEREKGGEESLISHRLLVSGSWHPVATQGTQITRYLSKLVSISLLKICRTGFSEIHFATGAYWRRCFTSHLQASITAPGRRVAFHTPMFYSFRFCPDCLYSSLAPAQPTLPLHYPDRTMFALKISDSKESPRIYFIRQLIFKENILRHANKN